MTTILFSGTPSHNGECEYGRPLVKKSVTNDEHRRGMLRICLGIIFEKLFWDVPMMVHFLFKLFNSMPDLINERENCRHDHNCSDQ